MSVALKKSPFPGISPAELAQQISGLRKFSDKVPAWSRTPGIYYPPNLNLEQTSSEATAVYKAGLASGNSMLDLCGGLGVDTSFLSPNFRSVTYCDMDAELTVIAESNFRQLGIENIRVRTGDGIEILRHLAESGTRPDWIYADPSRRHGRKGRVIRLEDYQPDIPANLDLLLGVSDNVLVKTSPLLDLSAGMRALRHVAGIHVVSVANEVRELVWCLKAGFDGETRVTAVDLQGKWPDTFEFTFPQEAASVSSFGPPLKYLYEPGAAVLKSGAFRLVGNRFGLSKLHRHTHLYTSGKLVDFPGRRFSIREVFPYKPGRIPYKQGHVNSRNFPEDVATIRKRNGIRSGGDSYLFFVRVSDDSLKVLVATAV